MRRINVGLNNLPYPNDIYVAVSSSEISDAEAKQLIHQALEERDCELPDDARDAIDTFKPFVRLGIIVAEVEYEDIDNPCERIARIILDLGNSKLPWLIPTNVLDKIHAAFPLAKLHCVVYACFPTFVWFISYAGPSAEELLKEAVSVISDKDLEELDEFSRKVEALHKDILE